MKDEGFMLDWTHSLIRVPGNSFVAEGKRFTKLFCDTYMRMHTWQSFQACQRTGRWQSNEAWDMYDDDIVENC